MSRKAGERDYRDGELRSADGKVISKAEKRTTNGTAKWWRCRTDLEVADAIRDASSQIIKAGSIRLRQITSNGRLYGNLSAAGPAGNQYARALQAQTATRERLTYNVVQENIDTLVSRVGEDKPRPYFLTSGGDYKQHRKAKKLNQAIEGIFYEARTYDIGLDAFRDAAIQGDGYVYVYPAGGKVCHEVVPGAELWVDELEARSGKPRNLYWVHDVDREKLMVDYPASAGAISTATAAPSPTTATVSDLVTVVEAWHLGAITAKGKLVGGKYACALHSNAGVPQLLAQGEWTLPTFPFAREPWCPRPTGQGYHSQGLAEQLQGTQLYINKNLMLIARSLNLAGSFKLLLHNGSKVVKESVSNEIGAMITWAGTVAPQYVTVNPIDRVFLEEVERSIQRSRQLSGNSQMSTGGEKPMGLDSGKALRTQQDIESDRHRTTQRHNNNLYLDLARLSIAVAIEMSERGEMLPIRVPGKRTFSTIDWKRDIAKDGGIKDSEFVMQCFPVSKFSKEPAARLAEVTEYMQAGIISAREGQKLLDFPDLESLESLKNAQEEIIERNLDLIIDESEYNPPEPTDDLQLAKEMVLEYIQRYRLLGLEDDKLDMLRQWSSQVDALQEMAAQAMMPAMPAAGAAPLGVPEAPPASPMLPNAPAVA